MFLQLWINELTVLGDTSLISQVNDIVYALARTQQVINHASNVFTGGIAGEVFDVKINLFIRPPYNKGARPTINYIGHPCHSSDLGNPEAQAQALVP